MTLISLRLPEKILNEADQHAKSLHLHRAEYICRAIEYWNQKSHHCHHHHAIKHQILRTRLRLKENSLPTINGRDPANMNEFQES